MLTPTGRTSRYCSGGSISPGGSKQLPHVLDFRPQGLHLRHITWQDRLAKVGHRITGHRITIHRRNGRSDALTSTRIMSLWTTLRAGVRQGAFGSADGSGDLHSQSSRHLVQRPGDEYRLVLTGHRPAFVFRVYQSLPHPGTAAHPLQSLHAKNQRHGRTVDPDALSGIGQRHGLPDLRGAQPLAPSPLRDVKPPQEALCPGLAPTTTCGRLAALRNQQRLVELLR